MKTGGNRGAASGNRKAENIEAVGVRSMRSAYQQAKRPHHARALAYSEARRGGRIRGVVPSRRCLNV